MNWSDLAELVPDCRVTISSAAVVLRVDGPPGKAARAALGRVLEWMAGHGVTPAAAAMTCGDGEGTRVEIPLRAQAYSDSDLPFGVHVLEPIVPK